MPSDTDSPPPTTEPSPSLTTPNEPVDSSDAPQFDPLGEDFLLILPDCIRDAALRVPRELFNLSESELQAFCYPSAAKRTREIFESDNRLRALFWMEHQAAQTAKRRMILKNVYADVILPANFINSFLKNPKRVAWLLLPFGSHIANVANLLKTGTDRIAEILALPVVRQICRCHWGCVCKKGVLIRNGGCACRVDCICPPITDTRTAELIIRIYEKMELRAKGAVPQVINQRIDARNLNLNRSLDAPMDESLQGKTIEEIDAEIARIESQIQTANQLPPPRDVVEIVSDTHLNKTDTFSIAVDIETKTVDNDE